MANRLSNDPLTTTADRIQFLLAPGEVNQGSDWPDYLQYGFTEAGIPALPDLVADETLEQADSESIVVWAALHSYALTLPTLSAPFCLTQAPKKLP